VQRDYVEYIAKELKIEHTEDWYNVTKENLESIGKPPIRMIEIMEIVKEIYPNIEIQRFREENFDKIHSTLKEYLKQVFPDQGFSIFCQVLIFSRNLARL
jgi:predicted RNA-binding protein Jag